VILWPHTEFGLRTQKVVILYKKMGCPRVERAGQPSNFGNQAQNLTVSGRKILKLGPRA
jgi:hypothetical protein